MSINSTPENKYSPWNIDVHKITPDKTKDKPSFPIIWEGIRHVVDKNLLVAHKSDFDIDCLIQSLKYYNLEIPEFKDECTFRRTGLKLEEACAAYKIELSQHHDAECDAKACANIYLHLMKGTEPDYTLIPIPKQNKSKGFGGKKIKKELLIPNLENADKNNPFYGKKIVFTGELREIEREDAAVSVKNMGADINTSISKLTDYVVVGSDPGPAKMNKVELLNNQGCKIKIIYENEFLNLIN